MSIRSLFLEGGVFGMTLLTIVLILIILAAWKAPAWVKELGLIALMTGVLWTFSGFYQISDIVADNPGITHDVIFGGVRVSLMPFFYGGSIYLASLILRIINKPRL